MNLHEYQGKNILSQFGVKIQRGIVASTSEEAVSVAKQLNQETGTDWFLLRTLTFLLLVLISLYNLPFYSFNYLISSP